MSSAIADIPSELVMAGEPECACTGNAIGMDTSPAATDSAIRKFSKRLTLMPTLSHGASYSAKGTKITITPAFPIFPASSPGCPDFLDNLNLIWLGQPGWLNLRPAGATKGEGGRNRRDPSTRRPIAMKRIRPIIRNALLAGVTLSAASAATARPPVEMATMTRMMACEGDGVSMELYLPDSSIMANRAELEASGMRPGTVIGYYALDLTDANKGKSLEPVRVTLSADKKTVTVDQYTRGLPPTRIPVKGGTVDFDQRFGQGAKCGPFQAQDPDYANKLARPDQPRH